MLLAVIAPLLVTCHLSTSPACEFSQPPNIRTGMLQEDFVELTQRSPTFRYPCLTAAQATRWAVLSRCEGPRDAYCSQALLKAAR